MICKKCGTTNDDNQKTCSNCGAVLYSTIEIKWQGILAGVIAASVFLFIAYLIYGLDDGWIYIGVLFSSLMAGTFATIFSKRDYVPTMEDDYNLMLHSFLAGTIFCIVIFPFHIMSDNILILLLAPGYGIFAIIGSVLGYFINIARERDIKWKIAATSISVLIGAFVIYVVFFSNVHDEQLYDDIGPLCISNMYLVDAIDFETNTKLNNSRVYAIKNETQLKDLVIRYERMKNLTEFSKKHSSDFVPYSSSEVEKEYAITMGKYSKLRTDYYGGMELAANLTLQGNISGAKKHYNKAQLLIPQIKKLNATFKTIENKDPAFKTKIQSMINNANTMVKTTKKLNTWMNPDQY